MQMPDLALDVIKRQLRLRRLGVELGGFALAAVLVAASAIWAKEGGMAPPLVAVSLSTPTHSAGPSLPTSALPSVSPSPAPTSPAPAVLPPALPLAPEPQDAPVPQAQADKDIRWFNGRPVRPVRTMWMTVTAYSPDARSCGDSADGITATLHDVSTNASRLVAADPRLLKYGSLLTIPGYDSSMIVPVLDCGGEIRGHRLDVLFPTHEQARRWGVRKLAVVVWGYADGKPADDPRRLR